MPVTARSRGKAQFSILEEVAGFKARGPCIALATPAGFVSEVMWMTSSLFGDDKQELRSMRQRIQDFLDGLRLLLHCASRACTPAPKG